MQSVQEYLTKQFAHVQWVLMETLMSHVQVLNVGQMLIVLLNVLASTNDVRIHVQSKTLALTRLNVKYSITKQTALALRDSRARVAQLVPKVNLDSKISEDLPNIFIYLQLKLVVRETQIVLPRLPAYLENVSILVPCQSHVEEMQSVQCWTHFLSEP